MKIKNACNPPVVFSAYTIVYFFLWIPCSLILLAWLNNELLAIGIISVGVLPVFYLFNKDHARSGRKYSDYRNALQSNFQCPDCKTPISDSVDHDEKYDLPFLFHCKGCDILWYVGLHNNTPT